MPVRKPLGVLTGILIALFVLVGLVAVLRMDTTGRRGSGLGDEFVYDISRWTATDPALVGYREESPLDTGFAAVRAIASGPAGRVYVSGDRAVSIRDAAGAAIGRIDLERDADALAVEPDGTVWAGSQDRVEAYGAEGKRLLSWTVPASNALVTGLAVLSNLVAAADARGRQVTVWNRNTGAILWQADGFIVPSPYFGVAAAPDGTLRIVDPGRHKIRAYTADGRLVSVWGQTSLRIDGFSGCCNPAHIAVLSDGAIVTSEKGLIRIKVYEPDGRLRSVVAGPETLLRLKIHPAAAHEAACPVAAGADGRVLVLDSRTRQVRIFVPVG